MGIVKSHKGENIPKTEMEIEKENMKGLPVKQWMLLPCEHTLMFSS